MGRHVDGTFTTTLSLPLSAEPLEPEKQTQALQVCPPTALNHRSQSHSGGAGSLQSQSQNLSLSLRISSLQTLPSALFPLPFYFPPKYSQ